MKTLITIGGIYHLGFAVFHLAFWRLFSWKKDLSRLSPVNRKIMQILNLRLTYVFVAVGLISLLLAESLLSSDLGKAVLIGVALFWLMRAIEQVVFFGLRQAASLVIFLVFLAGAAIYLYPVLF
jgi:hypothetical protein